MSVLNAAGRTLPSGCVNERWSIAGPVEAPDGRVSQTEQRRIN